MPRERIISGNPQPKLNAFYSSVNIVARRSLKAPLVIIAPQLSDISVWFCFTKH
jgi:hypothetical protein